MSWMIRMLTGSLLAAALAGCMKAEPQIGTARLLCPPLKEYSTAERKALKRELLACKDCRTVKEFLIDYRQLRRQVRACRK